MALNSSIHEKFKASFEHMCFQLIIEAYSTSLKEKVVQLDWNENDISSEICSCINNNPLRYEWKISIHVEAHLPKGTPKVKGFADRFPRIDFRLTTFISNYEYEYFFEAKNLKQNNSALKRRYIETGINNFLSRKYPNGSLVAYLLDGSTQDTIDGINSLLKKDKRDTELLQESSNEQVVIYTSTHKRIGILKHLIFDFTSLSN